MGHFKNSFDSHEHSLQTLELLYGYDSFLDSLKVIVDMGCGEGRDLGWWATLETREDQPEPRNYAVYGVDRTLKVDSEISNLPNVHLLERNFEDRILPIQADLIWSHDSFQYALDPIKTLRNWSLQLNPNGMLVMVLPQTMAYSQNRLHFVTENYSYHNYNICNLIYLLAVNGFDCKDAYFYKNVETNWIHLAVYKSEDPMDPATTSLYDLAEKNLLHPTVVNSLTRFGYIRQEDIVYPWLDRDFYQIKT
jgi:SAM-dependent methyltransferase